MGFHVGPADSATTVVSCNTHEHPPPVGRNASLRVTRRDLRPLWLVRPTTQAQHPERSARLHIRCLRHPSETTRLLEGIQWRIRVGYCCSPTAVWCLSSRYVVDCCCAIVCCMLYKITSREFTHGIAHTSKIHVHTAVEASFRTISPAPTTNSPLPKSLGGTCCPSQSKTNPVLRYCEFTAAGGLLHRPGVRTRICSLPSGLGGRPCERRR